MNTQVKPRGIRNNNPGNIEWGDPWQGLIPSSNRTDTRFAQFVSPEYGIRALARTLITYYDKYGINTVQGAINRWAPSIENDSNAYAQHVAKLMGVGVTMKLNFHDFDTMHGLVSGIIRHENGAGPLNTTNTWYSEDVIIKALALAGIERADTPTAAESGTVKAGAVAGASTAASIATDSLTSIVSNASASVQALVPYLEVAKYVFLALTLVAVGIAIYNRVKEQKRML